jgi:hypothetical protein
MKSSYGFSRRGPDRVAEELAAVLSRKASFEFKALFLIVHENLKLRNAASGGEEMLRLRAYEKLQNLVQAGIVKKTGKEYKGVPSQLLTFMETVTELNANFAAGIHSRPPVARDASSSKASISSVEGPKAPKGKSSAGKIQDESEETAEESRKPAVMVR